MWLFIRYMLLRLYVKYTCVYLSNLYVFDGDEYRVEFRSEYVLVAMLSL